MMFMLVTTCATAAAQYFPERALVREGNKQFERRNFRTAINRYEEALEHDSLSYEAQYNRANATAQYLINTPSDTTRRTERWRISNAYYDALAADTLLGATQRAEVLRNLGESLFMQQKYEAALNSFRESLLLNPDDTETKHNYILAKRIVDQKRKQQQNQQNQQGGDQNQDQNQEQQNNQQQNDNGDNQNKNNQDDQQNKDKNNPDEGNDKQNEGNNKQDPDRNQEQDREQDKDNKGEQPDNKPEGQPTPQGMSREEQERMLDAIQAEEDKTQDKLKGDKRGIVVSGKKNW